MDEEAALIAQEAEQQLVVSSSGDRLGDGRESGPAA